MDCKNLPKDLRSALTQDDTANIAVKVATQLNLSSAQVPRAPLKLPKQVDLFEVLSKSFGNIDLSKDSDTPRPAFLSQYGQSLCGVP
ncbi:hypothetical protein C7B69_10815 [filamentous cyanobacterium Phorm 46]|nr:hypothetical protein C7B69_10815 [filamentous cyanobacterium Phorm 46]PSB51468.1 hypothetical protein C7B67_10725 [filamentous cyanobacterium Phorm 6]